MAQQVCMGALMKCNQGAAPTPLAVLPAHRAMAQLVAANITDGKPGANVAPFGMCKSILNPAVLAATIKNLGALTPMPCNPVTPAPWLPGVPTVLLNGAPALNNSSKLMCTWGGLIEISFAGQATVLVP